MPKRAVVFPGQGSQSVGMGADLLAAFPAARETMEETDDALGFALSRLMAEGPADRLTLTENAQPALLSNAVAVLRVLERESGFSLARDAGFVAGHSLGEYSALVAAAALSLGDGVRIVRRRGEAMQQATPAGSGAMAALLGTELEQAQAIATDAGEAVGGVCTVANDNGGGQVVVSGETAAVEHAVTLAAERGFRRSVMLQVSAPFHSPLMAPAAAVMEAALAEVAMDAPTLPVVSNVTATPTRDPDEIRPLLVRQVTGMVRWRETVLYLRDQGVSEIVELGAGRVLAGLARRIDRDLAVRSIGAPADIDAFLSSL